MKFYTSTQNSRGKAVTAGAHRGQNTHTRTWTHGVRVVSQVNDKGEISFHLYSTKGSNAESCEVETPIGVVELTAKGQVKFKRSAK